MLTLSGVILVGSNLQLITSNSKYLAVIPLFSLGALVMLPRLLHGMPYLQLLYAKRSKTIFWSTLIALLVAVGGFVILIPEYQLKGALYAMGISNITFFLLLLFKSQGEYRESIPWMKNAGTVLLSIGLVLFSYYGCKTLNYGLGIYGLTQFILVALFLIFISTDEFRSVIKFKMNHNGGR